MFGFRFWRFSVLYTLGAALLIGIPTVLTPHTFFSRMTPTGPQDYVVWGISVAFISPIIALATLYPAGSPTGSTNRPGEGSGRALTGNLLSIFSVGCPICNTYVVLLLGIGGAMTLFNPLRPFLGFASKVLLGVTLFFRVSALRRGCPVTINSNAQ